MCHAGFFGLFRKIHEWTGHKCEPNHVVNLKSTLRSMLRATSLTKNLIHEVNGKVVYLIKTTDEVTTKLNNLSMDLKNIDKTFRSWQIKLDEFANTADCNHVLLIEFISKYSAEVNRAFSALLRLSEIQNVLSQISHFSQKTLIGFPDFPQFITDRLTFELEKDPDMQMTVKVLKQSFAILALPMVNYEYHSNHLELSILLPVPEITNINSLCTIQHLSSIKINISNVCYTGPVTQKDLVLITCANSQMLITTEALNTVNALKMKTRYFVHLMYYKQLTKLIGLGSLGMQTSGSHTLEHIHLSKIVTTFSQSSILVDAIFSLPPKEL